jgi:hypothetical protein
MSPTTVIRTNRSRENGTVLILVLMLSIVVTLTLASAVISTTAISRQSRFELEQAEAMALAEGVTEVVQKDILTKIANFESFASTGTVTIDAVPHDYTVVPIGGSVTRLDTDGVSMAIQPYKISATVNAEIGSSTISRVVDLTMTPIFQYMIFSQGDLEILPGPDMTLEGRVHSNGSIYVGTGGSSTLTVDTDYFHATGDILRKRKNDGTDTDGNIKIKVFGESSYNLMDRGEDSANAKWLSLAQDTWKGTVQTGASGVREVSVPNVKSIKAFDPKTGAKGYYHANASLVLIDGKAYDKGGAPVSLPAGTISEKKMYDAREGKNVTVTEVNIGLLNSSGSFPANGLVYAYRTDATSSQPNGIRLTNGAELKAPLTVVSEDPVYIRGDYNTKESKGSAVISDAVNLLSNSWDDSKVYGKLPSATETSYVVAMVTGNVPTPDGGGSYSGGFENLPRFHENWSGVTAKIRGAFINIYDSEKAKSPWKYGDDVYTAPNRDWRFDKNLKDMSKLPPFTPSAVYFNRVLWDDGLPIPFPTY